MAIKQILVAFGTRPEAIKMAPLIAALDDHPGLSPVVVVTGQHGQMLDSVLEMFGIQPDIDLGLHRPGQTLTDVMTGALEGTTAAIRRVHPDAIVVQGDTTTTFAGALAGFYEQVPVIHLEAGLRTGDVHDPFPEEANRRLTTQITALHLAATTRNKRALLCEHVPARQIVVTGNTVIDAVLAASRWQRPWHDSTLAEALGDSRQRTQRPTVLVTAHRRESWGEPLRELALGVADVATRLPDAQVIWPLHANPAVREWVTPAVATCPNVVLTGPARYDDFVRLMTIADVALTDSGGVQEEAPALGTPVLVARNVTERQEAVECGTARLVGTDRMVIRDQLLSSLERSRQPVPPATFSPYGDGRAAIRAACAIAALLGVGSREPDFDGARPTALVGQRAIQPAVAGRRAVPGGRAAHAAIE